MSSAAESLSQQLGRTFEQQNSLVLRITSEMEFAQSLMELENKRTWKAPLAKAVGLLESAAASGSLRSLRQAVAQAEALLSPVGKAAKRYTLHCVGHAHIDMNWLWSWPETVAATNDTLTTVLKLMEEFPDFRFSQSQASIYEILLRYSPELLEQVRRRVAEGRWEVTAPEWVEGDKNLASGESLARHLLYTRQFFAEQFGLSPQDVPMAWNPDTFGHARTIPSILSRGGVTRYYLCRGGDVQRPPLFWWQGPDGQRILVNVEQTWYNDTVGPHNVRGLLAFCKATGRKDWMLVYGIGDHGGGPTRRDLRRLQEMNGWPIFPNFRFATTADFFDRIEKDTASLPVYEGELNFEFTGCYTSQSELKKINRLAEHALESAESAAVLAGAVLGRPYPHNEFRRAWKDTLLGQFHDILPGSCVRSSREYQSGLFQQTLASTNMIQTHALRALAGRVDTAFAGESQPHDECTQLGAGPGRGTAGGSVSSAGHHVGPRRPFVIFNPSAWERTELVKLSLWDAENDNCHQKNFVVRTPDGATLPIQRGEAGQYWCHRFVDALLPVTVPALGYASLVVEESGTVPPPVAFAYGYDRLQPPAAPGRVRCLLEQRKQAHCYDGTWAMENERIYVEFDRVSGGIVRLRDKAGNAELVAADAPAALLEYVLEQPNGMSAWDIGLPSKTISPLELVSFKPVASGPHRAAFEAEYRVNLSTAKVTYLLDAGSSAVEIRVATEWLERGQAGVGTPALRMKFPFALTGAKGVYEVPLGSIERPAMEHQEVPSQRWVDVVGDQGGCALLNDCTYGFSLAGSLLRATLIRSSYFPDPLPEMGHHEMRFALLPHAAKLPIDALVRAGADFNRPLQAVATNVHAGDLPAAAPGAVSVSPAHVLLTAVKQAEQDESVILRFQETAGKAARVTVKIDTTLLGRVESAQQTDLLERAIEAAVTRTKDNGLAFSLAGSAIATVRVKLARR